MMNSEVIMTGMEIYGILMVVLVGACLGSFFNVVIYRLPEGKSVIKPRSHCSCGMTIAWYDNIPILSWFILRGKCRHCGQPFSFRYPVVEAMTALVFGGLWWVYPPIPAVIFMGLASLLIPAAFIDLDTMEIPDRFTVGGFLSGLILSMIFPEIHGHEGDIWLADSMRGLISSLQGAFSGTGLVIWIAVLAECVFRKEAMGFGDVKLMGAIGAFCGWQGAIFALFGGAVIGTLSLVLFIPRLKRMASESDSSKEGLRIPFGPALVAGSIVFLLFMREPVANYFESIHVVLY